MATIQRTFVVLMVIALLVRQTETQLLTNLPLVGSTLGNGLCLLLSPLFLVLGKIGGLKEATDPVYFGLCGSIGYGYFLGGSSSAASTTAAATDAPPAATDAPPATS
jgi:hypothetical protein